MTIPLNQCSPHGAATAKAKRALTTAVAPERSITHRQGDRGNPDDADTAPLRRWVRFRDLVAAGIVGNWPTLLRLIADEGFPPGRMIGANSRAWLASEIEDWLESRPLGRSPRKPTADEQHVA